MSSRAQRGICTYAIKCRSLVASLLGMTAALDAPYPEIHVIRDPLPQVGLIFGLSALAVVLLPRIHHLVVDRPHAHPVSRHLLFPPHGDRRTREEYAHCDVLRQIFELAHVDLLIPAQAVRL